jgi:hypothetical protein
VDRFAIAYQPFSLRRFADDYQFCLFLTGSALVLARVPIAWLGPDLDLARPI